MPLWEDVHRRVSGQIADGTLGTGSRLPSTRTLARELGLARATVEEAYRQLASDGWIQTRVGSGAYVLERPSPGALPAPGPGEAVPSLSSLGERHCHPSLGWPWREVAARRPATYEFLYGVPDMDLFPVTAWRRVVSAAAGSTEVRSFVYGPPEGLLPLRHALARWLGQTRGLSCDPENILVTAGFQQAVSLAVRVLVDPGQGVALEEPHYPGIRAAVAAEGARLLPVPVDGDGLDPSALPSARLAVVTACHQFPTGAILTQPRREALVAWARRTDAWILEDDYDGAFRWAGRPLPPLQTLCPERVLYAGTLSKTMFPSLRLGYLVLPPALVTPFRAARWVADLGAPVLIQEAVTAFIAGGHLDRHLRRARTRYDQRRKALISALERHGRGQVQISGARSGLHLLASLPDLAPAALPRCLEQARRAGVGAYPVAPCYLGEAPCAGLVLGYGLVELEGMDDAARLLVQSLEKERPCSDESLEKSIGPTGRS